jgi:hypothetical protein
MQKGVSEFDTDYCTQAARTKGDNIYLRNQTISFYAMEAILCRYFTMSAKSTYLE